MFTREDLVNFRIRERELEQVRQEILFHLASVWQEVEDQERALGGSLDGLKPRRVRSDKSLVSWELEDKNIRLNFNTLDGYYPESYTIPAQYVWDNEAMDRRFLSLLAAKHKKQEEKIQRKALYDELKKEFGDT